jgi:4,5-DOPA dioxygenase extradiol
MKRKDFIKMTGLAGMALPIVSTLNSLERLTDLKGSSELVPTLFLGHGSPMNALEDNRFVRKFKELGKKLPIPKAIVVVSAHWETKGTYVTATPNPKTIYDFHGFPKELYTIKYPAPGNPALASELTQLVKPERTIQKSMNWGLDHGTWSVLMHLFPQANIPVVQLSLDYTKDASYHYNLAKQLQRLRRKGIMVIGSGNTVHNLGKLAWNKISEEYAHDWANEADKKINGWIQDNNHKALIDFRRQGKAFDLAIPTPEHFLPLLYVLALKEKNEDVQLFNDKTIAGSLSMTSVRIM